MHKTIAIIAVGVLILAGALLYQNGGFKFSIIDGIKPGTWDTAVVTPWKIGNPLVATKSLSGAAVPLSGVKHKMSLQLLW